MILFTIVAILLCLDLAAIAVLTILESRLRTASQQVQPLAHTELPRPTAAVPAAAAPASVRVGPAAFGKTHNIGKRSSQQDSFGKAEVFGGQGVLAVVADGMGGLSGGDQVSQRVVMDMLSLASRLREPQMDGVLPKLVHYVNESVNQMLGPAGLYKSGSTLLAVLADGARFHWIAVGDSRIYLYRNGAMLQLNQEHTQLQDWMPDILNGRRTYEDALRDPNACKLTSFIGMGALRHIDLSLRSIAICPGDRILLLSDGVFNAVPESAMAQILAATPEVQQAADAIEQAVLRAQMPAQDNFTAVILGF